jgi:putative transposase
MHFQFDANAECQGLRFLELIVECSHLYVAIRVGRRWKAKRLATVLDKLASLYTAPN